MVGLRQQVVTQDCWQHTAEVPLNQSPVAKRQDNSSCDGSERQLAQLVRTIEGEIIPRLMLAHRIAPGGASVLPSAGRTPDAEDVVEFAKLVLAHDVGVAFSFIEAMRAEGVTPEMLFLDLLAPTAKRLGDLWNEDLCDFTEVTLGLCRLHQVLRELSPVFQHESEYPECGRRVLLIPMPGEQHIFGLSVVVEFFRRAGWDVWDGAVASSDELVELVRGQWFNVIGFSVSCESRLDALAAGIRAIRRASRNRAIGVLVGGRVFIEQPDLVAFVGADATAVDARQAALQAENLLTLLARA